MDSLQWYSGRKKLKIRNKIVKTVKEPDKMCHEIDPNPSKDRAVFEGYNPSFCDEYIKFTFFLDSFIYICISEQVQKYLATGL
jgi:hypothetical protein